jgi:hypothetical protein
MERDKKMDMTINLSTEQWTRLLKKIRVKPEKRPLELIGSFYYVLTVEIGDLSVKALSPIGYGEETSFTGKPEDRLGSKK